MARTDTQIRQIKPQDKPYKLSDANGLYLLVKPTGGRYWRFKYRYAGKEKLLSLGVYPRLSLKQARKGCADAKELLDHGLDPSLAKKVKKAERYQSLANNLEAIAREWHTQQSRSWSEGYAEKYCEA